MKKLDKIFDEEAEIQKGEKQEDPDDLVDLKKNKTDKELEKERLKDFLKSKKIVKPREELEEELEKELEEMETNSSELKPSQLIIAQTQYDAIIVQQNLDKVFTQVQALLKDGFDIQVIATKKFIP